MKRKIFFMMMLGCFALVQPCVGQQSGATDVMSDRREMMRRYIQNRNPSPQENASADQSIEELLKQRSDQDEAGKQQIEQKMKAVLEQEYDRLMNQYEGQISEMESRLAQMKQQLERRREARQSMVQLRLLNLLAEADNIRWPSQQQNPQGSSYPMESALWQPGGSGAGSRGGYPGGGSGSSRSMSSGFSGGTGSPFPNRNNTNIVGEFAQVDPAANKPLGLAGDRDRLIKDADPSTHQRNRLRMAMLAMHNYHETHRQFPLEEAGQWSWQARLLPFIGAGVADLDTEDSVLSESNQKAAEAIPELFRSDDGATLCWVQSDIKSIADIHDGASNTIALIAVPNDYLPEDLQKPWIEQVGLTEDQVMTIFEQLGEKEPLYAALYDGSVHRYDRSLDRDVLQALLTPQGREVVPQAGQNRSR